MAREPILVIVDPKDGKVDGFDEARAAGFSFNPFSFLKPRDLLRFLWGMLSGVAAKVISNFLEPALEKASDTEKARLSADFRAAAAALDTGDAAAAADSLADVIASFRLA